MTIPGTKPTGEFKLNFGKGCYAFLHTKLPGKKAVLSRFKKQTVEIVENPLAYQPDFTICLDTNSKHKSQGCARFAQKTTCCRLSVRNSSYLLKQPNAFNANFTCFFGSPDKAGVCDQLYFEARMAFFYSSLNRNSG